MGTGVGVGLYDGAGVSAQYESSQCVHQEGIPSGSGVGEPYVSGVVVGLLN